MPAFTIKPAGSCKYDSIALGEIMLRLDPGEGRVRTAREFKAWEGGGEYNVARGLRRCFGLKTAVCTAFADNDVGRLIEDFILQGGVDAEFIKWVAYDGVGRTVRNGLNFTERGFGIRGAVGIPDRGHTAASQLKPGVGDIDGDGFDDALIIVSGSNYALYRGGAQVRSAVAMTWTNTAGSCSRCSRFPGTLPPSLEPSKAG
jgi:2-dehydro-3-deoxygluconokinase